MKSLLFSCLALAVPTLANAQSFQAPIEIISPNTRSMAVLNDGTTVEGNIKAYMVQNGSLRSFTLVDASGTKHKLKAADVKSVEHEPGALARMAAASEVGSSLMSALKNMDKLEGIFNRKTVDYITAPLPKSGKSALMQLLNPGWNEVMSVFMDPSTTMEASVMGFDIEKQTLLVSKRGAAPVVVKKGSYKKDAEALYGDCPEAAALIGDKPKFKEMAVHVLLYSQTCP